MQLSIVIPAYNESSNIKTTLDEVVGIVKNVPAVERYELIVVDDHSADETFEAVQSLKNKAIKCIRLSKHSGSHVAIRAGLAHVQGDVAVFIAADGQDNPHALPEMLSKWQQGNHVIWALRKVRKEPLFQELSANLFYRLITLLTPKIPMAIDLSKADFCLLDRKAIDAFNAYPERRTSLLGLIVSLGFKQSSVEYDRRKRRAGTSKWNFRRRFNLAKDWIIAFSEAPLRMMILVGFFVALMGFLYALFIVLDAFGGHPIQGWALTIAVILIIGGFHMLMLGVMGAYLWHNLDETRKRPLYFIEKSTLTT